MTLKPLDDLLRAYGALYLVENRLAAGLLVMATMLNPVTGCAGVLAGLSALGFRRLLGLPPALANLDAMNAVFVGLYLAGRFPAGLRLALLVVMGAGLAVLLMRVADRLLRDTAGLPVLSLPFLLTTWCLLAVANGGGFVPLPSQPASTLPAGPLPVLLQTFGSLYCAPDAAAGTLVLAALLLSSPTLCLLGLFGYGLASLLVAALTGSDTSSLLALAGPNAIVTAMVVGGILAAPRRSQWAIAGIAVALSTLLTIAASSLLAVVWLPVLSLPFVLATHLAMGVFRGPGSPDWARYWRRVPARPEQILERERQAEVRGIVADSIGLAAPFTGTWDVYQGFDGAHTHRGNWRHGLDFIRMIDGASFAGTGSHLADYHCFSQPVVSPVFGTVVSCRDDLPDNRPGEVDTVANWGNSIVIAVAGGAHAVLAHLQQHSLQVLPGAFVYPGLPLARCGNSGRSPQPHLHLHVQTSPVLGAATRRFHLAGVLDVSPDGPAFQLDLVPRENDRITAATASPALREALRMRVGTQRGYRLSGPVVPPGPWLLTATLDLDGRAMLAAGSGAAWVRHETVTLVALSDRAGPRDRVMDAYGLAVGLTPLVEGAATWTDAPSPDLLPLRGTDRLLLSLLRLVGVTLDSRYARSWRTDLHLWEQTGHHTLRLGPVVILTVESGAFFCETDGVTGFAVSQGGRPLVSANLETLGLAGDIGIPAWSAPVARPPASASA